MRLQTKKMAVLEQLREEAEPIGLLELLKKLGEAYTDRTLRRWLAEMVKEGSVEILGRKKGTKYLVRQSKTGARSLFSTESLAVIEQVRKPYYERIPISYVEEWLDTYQPNETYYLSSEIRTQLYNAGKRSKSEEPAGTFARQIFDRLLIDLSYNSSRLEGNTYSILETEKLLFEGHSAEGKLDEEKTMILNHKEAIRFLVDSAHQLKILPETIFTLHYLLSDGLIDTQYTGKVRNVGVRISGSTYIPFEDSKRLKHQLERVTQKAALIEDPYEQSFFLLVHLSYLQAFIDVNKRTARLSANIPLIMKNLVPLSFNDIEKEDYTNAVIAIYELQNVRPLVDLYVFSYLRTCALYDETAKAIGFDEVRVRYRQQRRSMIGDIIVHSLVGEEMNKHIDSRVKQIPSKDQHAFLEDLKEDLEALDSIRIVGLGVTSKELEVWKKKFESASLT
ncbi:MAG TPA: Fic family protein [Rhabdochlamydiaceae bacterium]|nr:Fic family protein [Rhabdochlamydiaceae bacterium]